MKKTPQSKPLRQKLRCTQCQGEIVVFGQPGQYQNVYTPPLCPTCGPALYQRCGRFLLYEGQRKPTPPPDLSKGQCAPRRIEVQLKVAEDIAGGHFNLACNGNQRAAEALAELTFFCVHHLQMLAQHYPEVLRPTAHTTILWPFFYSRKHSYRETAERLMTSLEVGKAPVFGGRWHQDSPAMLTAQTLFEWLNGNVEVLQLPAIAKATLPAWFEVGWRRFLFETKGEPHKIPCLTRLGNVKNWAQRAVRVGLDEATPAMKKTTSIAKIKEVVAKSFFGLFQNLPP